MVARSSRETFRMSEMKAMRTSQGNKVPATTVTTTRTLAGSLRWSGSKRTHLAAARGCPAQLLPGCTGCGDGDGALRRQADGRGPPHGQNHQHEGQPGQGKKVASVKK